MFVRAGGLAGIDRDGSRLDQRRPFEGPGQPRSSVTTSQPVSLAG